jgi:hypothetical protein
MQFFSQQDKPYIYYKMLPDLKARKDGSAEEDKNNRKEIQKLE